MLSKILKSIENEDNISNLVLVLETSITGDNPRESPEDYLSYNAMKS